MDKQITSQITDIAIKAATADVSAFGDALGLGVSTAIKAKTDKKFSAAEKKLNDKYTALDKFQQVIEEKGAAAETMGIKKNSSTGLLIGVSIGCAILVGTVFYFTIWID